MRYGDSIGLGEVEVSVDDLLAFVTSNRNNHRGIFEKALIIYRKKAISTLDDLIALLKEGKTPSLWVNLPVPEDHTDDYDRAIGMLKWHTKPTIILNEEAYARLVNDDWGWSHDWASNTYSYVEQQ